MVKTMLMNKVNWMLKGLGEDTADLSYSNGEVVYSTHIKKFNRKGVEYGYTISSMHEEIEEITNSHFSVTMESSDHYCFGKDESSFDDEDNGVEEYWDTIVEFKAEYDPKTREWVITDIIDDDYLDEYDNEDYTHMHELMEIMKKRYGLRYPKLDMITVGIKGMYEWIKEDKWDRKVL